MDTPASTLDRFRRAQDQRGNGFESALAELEAGRKRTHWIWYVFPQLQGLGHSPDARAFAIHDVAEATAYMKDSVLGGRLVAITRVVAARAREGVSLRALMGSEIDVLKLVSSMTLFERVGNAVLASQSKEPHVADLVTAADQVLTAAAREGYPRCRYTLAALDHPSRLQG